MVSRGFPSGSRGVPVGFPWGSREVPIVAKLLNCLWSLSRQTLKKPQDQGLHLNSIDADLGNRDFRSTFSEKTSSANMKGKIIHIHKL